MKYVKKLVPKKKSSPLIRGSIIHECLEAYYNGKSWKKVWRKFADDFYSNTFEEERAELGDIPAMAYELLENYFHYYEEEDEDTIYLHNELHFELPLTDGVNIQGYIDAVIKDSDGKVWVKDYKTYKNMKDREFFLYNMQSAIYIWAMQEMGYEVEGVIWDVIKAKEPSKPKVNKDGSLSKARLDSLPLTVEKALIELGFNPEDHTEYLEKFSYENYFQRHKIRLNQSTINFMMEDIRESAEQIRDHGEEWKDMNLGSAFPSPYKEIWQAEMMGMDTDYIIAKRYERRQRDGETEEETVENEG